MTRSDEWLALLETAIGGLRGAAETLKKRKAEFENKTDWFRAKSPSIPRENSVTRALAELFRQAKAQQIIRGAGPQRLDLRHISIECERPRPLDPGISDKSKPTDLSLTIVKDTELDLRIEAKTVVDETEVQREYLGPRGLERFEDHSNPYTIEPYGAMLAYVVDNNAQTWVTRIAAQMEKKLGAARCSALEIGTQTQPVSLHQINPRSEGGGSVKNIRVVHFALEIDAKPPMR